MKFQRPRGKSALTLVELLVVIAIIAILAALLLPVISQSKAKARKIQCIGNLHQLGVGLQVILSNDHGYPLFIENRYSSWINQMEIEGFGISKPEPHYPENGVWHCPSAKFHKFNANEISMSYGYNAFGNLLVGNRTNNLGLHGYYEVSSNMRTPIKDSEVIAPSEMMAIGESDGMTFMRSESYDFYKVSLRHDDKANVVFCDGHVESPTLQFLFEDTSDEALSRWNRDHLPHREKVSP
jgi:prepilin-type processing-associated H-X9-DG protein/prepilin-type N-terminal cleavage/methylation domain-containing protein